MTDTGFSQPLFERVELPGITQVSAMSRRPQCTRVRPCACASPVHARRGTTRWFCDRARGARADCRGARADCRACAQPGRAARADCRARAQPGLTPRVRVVQGSEYRVRSDLEEKEPNMQEKDTFEKAGIFSP